MELLLALDVEHNVENECGGRRDQLHIGFLSRGVTFLLGALLADSHEARLWQVPKQGDFPRRQFALLKLRQNLVHRRLLQQVLAQTASLPFECMHALHGRRLHCKRILIVLICDGPKTLLIRGVMDHLNSNL